MIKQRFFQLIAILNYKSLRERAFIGGTVLFAILAIWYLLIYEPQVDALQRKEDEINVMKEQVQFYQKQKDKIQQLLADEKVQNLIEKHGDIVSKIKSLDEKIGTHQQQIISAKQLSTLLHSMLANVKGVSIVKFSTIDKVKGLSNADEAQKLSAANVKLQHYVLVLSGKYFEIKAYLSYLEKLKWQIYWEKMDYKVEKHPLAKVTLYFYTLSADEES